MIKVIAMLMLLASLAGCYAVMPVKYAANQVCGASTERKAELARGFDGATYPHKVRVHCHAQEEE